MASKKDNLPVNIQEEQEQGSSITYAPEVLNIITLTAVNEVEGIAGLSNANGSLLRKGNTAKGIRIEQSPEEVSVELFLVVEYEGSGVGALEEIDTAQKCGLAGAARAEDRDDVAFVHGQVDAAKDLVRAK